jgi:hypothetical protein
MEKNLMEEIRKMLEELANNPLPVYDSKEDEVQNDNSNNG